MSHPINITALQNALETGAHPRLASSSRIEKKTWIESFMHTCPYDSMSRDERGVVRAYIQAVTGYSRAQMARYVSSLAPQSKNEITASTSVAQLATAQPSKRRIRWFFPTVALLLLLLVLLLPRFGTNSPLAFLTLGSSVSSEGTTSSQSDSFTVRTVSQRQPQEEILYTVDTRVPETVFVDSSARTYPLRASALSPVILAPTTLHDRVYARRDARLNIGGRGEVFAPALHPRSESLLDILGAGKEGQVLMYQKGKYVWSFPNFTGTGRMPTGSGSTRRSGGGGGGGTSSQSTTNVVNTYNTYITGGSGSGLGVFVGTTTVTSYTGQLTSGLDTGYKAANALCNAQYAGSHLCMTDEILSTIQTQDISTLFSGVADAWIAEGPPGFTANSNDCAGWTSASAAYLGPWWEFDATGGGIGYLTNCSTTKPLACCM